MKKTWLVLIYEIRTVLGRTSFWLAALGVPLLGAILYGLAGMLKQNPEFGEGLNRMVFNLPSSLPSGYVDQSGIIRQANVPGLEKTFLAYPDEESALHALRSGEIDAFYIVLPGYLEHGRLVRVCLDYNPLIDVDRGDEQFEQLLQMNLLGGDWNRARLLGGPLEEEEVALVAVPRTPETYAARMWLPYGMAFMFSILILGAASLLLSTLSKEKESRVIETLLTSLHPRQLFVGKIVALGLGGLLQMVLWLGASYSLLNLSGRSFQWPFSLPASILMWGIVFFLLGYAVYASLMAGLGALAPNFREASQLTFLITFPLLVPLFFSSTLFVEDPNGPIAVFLSLFPFSAPVAMMSRLAAGEVVWWHPWLAATLLAITAVLIMRATAALFRTQTLLSGRPVNVKTYVRALLGRQ